MGASQPLLFKDEKIMIQKKVTLLASLLLTAASLQAQEGLVINELMQSNIDYLMVEKDFPDSWAELYNSGSSTISLRGYRIGEKEDFSRAWVLPSQTIEAGGHLVIYCDKEARGLHTDFRIDSGKASLYLFNPSGEIVDHIELPEMPAANIAYGRVEDGSQQWQYELTPTAGEVNSGGGSDKVLPAPVFSVEGGVFNGGSVVVTISMPEEVDLPEDTRIYVTNDGTEPTQASRYYQKEGTIVVPRTMVLRAKLISQSALSPRSTTHSYIFHPRETNLPIVSLVSDRNYFYGNDIGILSGNVTNGTPNYMQSWRRPLNIEYFDMQVPGESKRVFNQVCETAVSGVSTREQPQKSMKIYANKRFGKKTFKGDFWADKPDVNKVKSFVLRSGGNNSFTTRINDAAVQRLFGWNVDELDWQAYRPVIVYLNGNYIGEFGMRERSNEDFVEANHDISDVEMADETDYQSPQKGSLFESFRNLYRKSGSTYEELAEQMDVDNFMATLVAEIYAMNTDYPTNNVSMWRPKEEGGKWRWILKDLDRAGMNITLYPETFDMFQYLFNPDDLMFGGLYYFDLYTKMISLPEFRERFIDMMSVQLGDFLKPEHTSALLDNMSQEIFSELQPTFLAYNCISEWNHYGVNFSNLKSFLANRPRYIYGQMQRFFGLGEYSKVRVLTHDSKVEINDIALCDSVFDGNLYQQRTYRITSREEGAKWQLLASYSDGRTDTILCDTTELQLHIEDYVPAEGSRLASLCCEVLLPEVNVDPEDPEEPENPDTPEGPEDPDNPDTPVDPDQPEEPEDSDAVLLPQVGGTTLQVYTLTGLRIRPEHMQSGHIYLVNGRKVIAE